MWIRRLLVILRKPEGQRSGELLRMDAGRGWRILSMVRGWEQSN